MGILKTLALLSGIPVRPTTTRERARMYQRRSINQQKIANELMEEQNQILEAQIQQQLDTQNRLLAQQKSLEKTHASSKAQSETLDAKELIKETAHSDENPDDLKSALNRLEKLAELKESGALTEDEFQTLKSQTLESYT